MGAGIIPAGAGLTYFSLSELKYKWDHPRGCGAHALKNWMAFVISGSSPRVRGSHCGTSLPEVLLGIIPAGAGLTSRQMTQRNGSWDHPRGCGAHSIFLIPYKSIMGSSPRVRGSLLTLEERKATHGIIPAGAGLTPPVRFVRHNYGDHPRGCGAHSFFLSTESKKLGSSPRVRGSH